MKRENIKHKVVKAPPKTFMKEHHWIENPNQTAIVVCSCGNKYMKTRIGQTMCI